jgi:hypothetical protein
VRPLIESFHGKAPSEELIAVWMEQMSVGREEAIRGIEADWARCRYFVNDLYQVEVRPVDGLEGVMVQLNIRRRDGNVIFRDWRHFQEIKNQLVGPECEGVELYPAESRLTDTTNKYHIWVFTDPTYRVPFGFPTRDVEPGRGGKRGVCASGRSREAGDDRTRESRVQEDQICLRGQEAPAVPSPGASTDRDDRSRVQLGRDQIHEGEEQVEEGKRLAMSDAVKVTMTRVEAIAVVKPIRDTATYFLRRADRIGFVPAPGKENADRVRGEALETLADRIEEELG